MDPDTYYAPAERMAADALMRAVRHCSRHPMLGILLQSFGGVLAVLNRERQILAVNPSLLEMLGVVDAGTLLGLRPGEAIRCTHRADHPGGCGTSRVCSTCGAAIALVTCQEDEQPKDAECVVTVEQNGANVDLRLRVRATPFDLDGVALILLLLEDVSLEHRRASLERAFFHDLNNLLMGLAGTAELLDCDDRTEFVELQRQLRHQAERLSQEVAVQRVLCRLHPESHRIVPRACEVTALLQDLVGRFENHPSAEGRRLRVTEPHAALSLRTDPVLAARVLGNMVLNAFEATDEGGEVRIDVQPDRGGVLFEVWNQRAIRQALQPRIFQRYFSTKRGEGRGTGTFAMKLIGEEYLHGRVGFTSSREEGTTFRLWLPDMLLPRV